ncbi:MAG: electron transport complex protein RnfG [Saprospiraceae bacterium]|jgi:electron transport complex protein RnfG
MNETQAAPTIVPTSSTKMLQAMVGIGIICALLIVLTFEGTKPRIEKLRAEALEKAIFKVIPDMVTKRSYQLDQNNSFTEMGSEDKAKQLFYAGYDENGKMVGVAVEASGIGFADVLRVLYGYDPDKEVIVGFYVLESKETPGLGDKIEKDDDFLANFKALDVSLLDDKSALKNKVIPVKHGAKENPWEVDGITGATISSRAIGDIIGSSAEQWVPLIYNNKETFESEKTQ